MTATGDQASFATGRSKASTHASASQRETWGSQLLEPDHDRAIKFVHWQSALKPKAGQRVRGSNHYPYAEEVSA